LETALTSVHGVRAQGRVPEWTRGWYGLLERGAEHAVANELIDAAHRRVGSILAVEGRPGIGKTRLLQAIRTSASEADFTVASARGGELERDFAYGVVRQLFEPLLFSAAPPEREALLAGAANLATRVLGQLDAEDHEPATTVHSTLYGLYWFTANLAAQKPLLICLDDAHWSDAPSLRFLAYLAHRLDGLPVLLAIGTWPAEGRAAEGALDELLSDPATRLLHPAPLSEAAVGRLLRVRLGPWTKDVFARACHDATKGNPFLLSALIGALRAEGVCGTAADSMRLRGMSPPAVSRAVLRRLAALPAEALQLAGAVAVLGDEAILEDACELASLDVTDAAEAADALAQIEILRPGLPLGFVHPIIRAAVHAEVAPRERQQQHAAAARMLANRGSSPEQVAAQLLAAAPSGTDWVVDPLRRAAQAALIRGAPDVAVTYLRRALAEPPAVALRGEVLFELGIAEARSELGGTRRMAEALELSADPARRAAIALWLGRTLGLRGEHDQAVQVLERAHAEIADTDVQLRLRLEAETVAHCLHSAAKLPLGFERLERMPSEVKGGGTGHRLLLAMAGFAQTSSGRLPPAAAAALARKTALEGDLAEEANLSLLLFTAETLVFADHLEEADRLLDEAIASARRRGSMPGVALASTFQSQVALRRGSVREAEADARQALKLVGPDVLGYCRTYALSFLVDALIERGAYEEADHLLRETGPLDTWPELWQFMLLAGSRGRLRIAQGRVAEGLADVLECGRRVAPWRPRNPSTVPWRSEAALAHARLGERDEAQRLAAWELRNAHAVGALRGLGVALRTAGLVEGGNRGLELLHRATTVLARSTAKLEYARALTDLGSALRRGGHRSDARGPLRQGLDLAQQCGARPLSERAHHELVATGARPRRLMVSGVESLTPSEQRVARMAAEGSTNREVAQALFVTEKTVEVHLTRTYRKLGIRSRSQLPGALSDENPETAETSEGTSPPSAPPPGDPPAPQTVESVTQ
jgi:DNA-binding CsgD family transcriptional regulator